MKNIVEILNEAVETQVNGMRLAQPTGRVLDEDSSYIEVLIDGKSVYARPCMPFGVFAVPSKEWWAENSDKWLVWVTFEMNNPAHPVWMGMCPLDNVKPDNANYPNCWELKTRKWSVTIDDIEDTVTVKSKTGGEKVKVTPQNITFGGGNESLILGDQLTNFLGQLIDTLSAASIVTPSGPGTFDPGVITNLQTLKTQFQTMKSLTIKIE